MNRKKKKNILGWYLVWGSFGTAAGFVILYFLLRSGVPYFWSTLSSQLINSIISFFFHKFKTFKDKQTKNIGRQAAAFMILRMIIFTANFALVILIIKEMKFQHHNWEIIATQALVGLFFTIVLTPYIISNFVFPNPKST